MLNLAPHLRKFSSYLSALANTRESLFSTAASWDQALRAGGLFWCLPCTVTTDGDDLQRACFKDVWLGVFLLHCLFKCTGEREKSKQEERNEKRAGSTLETCLQAPSVRLSLASWETGHCVSETKG